MEYRQVGVCGLKVSELCLGTMTFGHGTGEAEAKNMVSAALDAGVNFFDTANSYADAQSETILGRALEGRRGQVVLATKFYNPMGSGPNDSGMSRYHIMNAVEASLSRLGTDHIDIYYIHHVDQETPIEEMLRAVDDLVHQGKVRYIACSNYEAWRLLEALWISRSNGLAEFICYQPQYSLLVRDIEATLIPACKAKGLGIVCWSPLGGGYLSGKYQPGTTTLDGTRSAEGWAYPDKFFHEDRDAIVETLLAVASELNRPTAAVAIRWVLEHPDITSAIVGARTMEHLATNLGAIGWRLPQRALDRLNRVSEPRVPYPESMEWTRDSQRLSAIERR